MRDQPPVCPKCGQGQIIEGRRGFGCNRFREGCDFVVWKSYGGRDLSEGDIRALIELGQTGLINDIEGAGAPTRLRLDANWQVVAEAAGIE
jgi:DNA topoisomerase-3